MDIKVEGVWKTIDATSILKDVSFSVEKGDIFALVGPNGAGKTTLIRLILNLYYVTAGDILVNGISVNSEEYNEVRRKIGFVLENVGLFRDLNAFENVEFFDRIYNPGALKQDRERRISDLLKMVDLYSRKDSKIPFFSRGMKQRLALARALVNDPELLILDEPARGLDLEGQLMLRTYLSDICQKQRTVFINSHNLSELQKVCTKIAFINDGKILDFGTYEELRQRFCENTYLLSLKKTGPWLQELAESSFVNWYKANNHEVIVSLKQDFTEFPEWLKDHDVVTDELVKVNNELEDIYQKVMSPSKNPDVR